MDNYKKVSINQLAVYLSNVYTKLENKWYSQDVNDWMDDIRKLENNSIYTSCNWYIYDSMIYNENGEAERLTIGFKDVEIDGIIDIEYYLPKNVNL